MSASLIPSDPPNGAFPLEGIRIVEVGGEEIEYVGLLLAGLGADLVKVEPPGGAGGRNIGPFYGDIEDPNGSLFFWQYNRGKQSIVLDFDAAEDRQHFEGILAGADILLQSGGPRCLLDEAGFSSARLAKQYPEMIIARMSPFGETGPWSEFRGSDLVNLALGGVLMNCGYDPEPDGFYDLPPIAPQMWHSFHISGDQLAIGIVASLIYRMREKKGQVVSCAMHNAISVNTEMDLMGWIMRRAPLYRQTARHAQEKVGQFNTIAATKDGRWLMHPAASGPSRQGQSSVSEAERVSRFVASLGLWTKPTKVSPIKQVQDIKQIIGREITGSASVDVSDASDAAMMKQEIDSLASRYVLANLPWREGQEAGIIWAPVRKPHENAVDEHWAQRNTFSSIEHPEHQRSFLYATSKWRSTAGSWKVGRRAPLLDEDRDGILSSLHWAEPRTRVPLRRERNGGKVRSPLKRPFALQGIRILDFSWFLASAGGTRFLAALGAECIKVEWKGRPDTRLGSMAPIGGREARERASAPLGGVEDADMGGQFNNKNPGKLGISLNLAHPKGLEIAKAMVGQCDVVAEGFSPGTMERLGLGYEVLRSIRPDVIYIQQSGMGMRGSYGRLRTAGPIAQSLSGLTDMSGFPEPAPPAGWGYSYLDWMGAYSFALATLTAIYHRELTGEGQWIDSSQTETGIFLNGTAIVDWSAHGRDYARTGNRSPFKAAAPHGIYRCKGTDRWIAISCYSDQEWENLARIADRPEWITDARFLTQEQRISNQDRLDEMVECWSVRQDAYDIMFRLQGAGVAAGVCQTAEDRCDHDPQLAHLGWLTELNGTKIGRWPVAAVPLEMNESPPHVGGITNRGAPCYGEDNYAVFKDLLGLTPDEVDGLAREGVI